eukprot:1093333-Alexandrium_andersonii.AAC.1
MVRGMVAWVAGISRPDLMVIARLPDDMLVELGSAKVADQVRASSGILLSAVDLSQPICMELYVDSSMDSRQVSKVRGRAAGLFVLRQEGLGSLVSWFSRLHKRVAVSSDVAECRAICEGIHTSLYLKELLHQMTSNTPWPLQVTTLLKTDSMGMVQFVHRQMARSRDLDYLLLKELSSLANIEHIPGVDNPADALTKLVQKAAVQYKVLQSLMDPSQQAFTIWQVDGRRKTGANRPLLRE